MRTWEEIKTCFKEDRFNNVNDKNMSKEYKEFIDEFIHYIKIGLAKANMKYLAHRFNSYYISVLVKKDSKLYICSFANWRLTYEIYICIDSKEEFYNGSSALYYYTKYKSNSFSQLTADAMFLCAKFPKHAKYNIGDLVQLNANGIKKYCRYFDGDRNKVLRITRICYNSKSINYYIEALIKKNPNDTGTTYNSYAESNLIKIKKGI